MDNASKGTISSIILLLFIVASFTAGSQSTIDEQKRISTFVREWIGAAKNQSVLYCTKPTFYRVEHDPLFSRYITMDELDSMLWFTARLDTFFSEADILYMHNQLNRYRNYKWKCNDYRNANWISAGKLHKAIRVSRNKVDSTGKWKWFRERNMEGFCEMSVPLFSIDGEKVLFYSACSCGPLWARGSTKIYQWKNGMWQLINEHGIWVS